VEMRGNFLLSPEILGYQLSHLVRACLRDSVPANPAFSDQRISSTAGRLASRCWRSICACVESLGTRPHLSESANCYITHSGHLRWDNGSSNGHRRDHSKASPSHQRDRLRFDVAGSHFPDTLGNAAARNARWGNRHDADRPMYAWALSALVGGLTAGAGLLLRRFSKQSTIPYGPFLVVGTIATLAIRGTP